MDLELDDVKLEMIEEKTEDEQCERQVKCESDEDGQQFESPVTTPVIVWQYEDIVVKKELLNIDEMNKDEQQQTNVKCELVENIERCSDTDDLNIKPVCI